MKKIILSSMILALTSFGVMATAAEHTAKNPAKITVAHPQGDPYPICHTCTPDSGWLHTQQKGVN